MRSRPPDPSPAVVAGGELTLANKALVELLRAVLDKGRAFRFRATGFSMLPCIRDGDAVLIAPLARSRGPRLGQVVACVAPDTGQLVVHRVVARRGASFLLRGDNSSQSDGLVPPASILGCVIGVERDGRATRIGLGPERILIALLSRRGCLRHWFQSAWRIVRRTAGETAR